METVFWIRLKDLCEKHKTSPTAVAREIGLSNATSTQWKKGSVPNGSTLSKIAARFGVTVGYLLGEESGTSTTVPRAFFESSSLSGDEQKIILTYRTNETFREAVNNIYRLTTQGVEPTATIRVYRAARSNDDRDAEVVEMNAARLAALDALPDTDEL